MLASYLEASAGVIRDAAKSISEQVMSGAVTLCVDALKGGKPILVCGNGGSAADAIHITGELVGRFLKERRALRAICLADNPAVLTAWSNDYSYETVFSRQVEAYGEQGAVLIGLSTSGNSPNVVKAFEAAKALQMSTLAFTGGHGGKLKALSDVALIAPSQSTQQIQQVHLCLYHYLCEKIEEALVG